MTVKYRMRRVPIDDTAQDGKTNRGISSNWAYDHTADFGLHSKLVVKTADEIVNNSTTLQADDELILAVLASEVWLVHYYLFMTSGTTPDFKVGFAYPTNCEIEWFYAGTPELHKNETESFNKGTLNTDEVFRIIAYVRVGDTAGNVTIKWAQNVATASDTTVFAKSCLIATKVV